MLYCFKKCYLNPLKLHDRGGALVEFALIAPIFFLVLFGIFEVSAIILVHTSLEIAVYQVSRFGRTGDTVAGQTQLQTAGDLASNYSFGLVDPAKLRLTATTYASFGAIPDLKDAPTVGTNFGTGQQIVLYTLAYDWKMFTPLVSQFFTKNGTITITASTVVLNEPF